MIDTDKRIEEAEKEISAVLAKLEADTGMVLDTIKVIDTDVTNIDDARRQWLRSVVIDMKRLPGTRWA